MNQRVVGQMGQRTLGWVTWAHDPLTNDKIVTYVDIRDFDTVLQTDPRKILLFALFLPRDAMLSAVYATAIPSVCPSVRPSVCLSVRHTGGSVKNGWS